MRNTSTVLKNKKFWIRLNLEVRFKFELLTKGIDVVLQPIVLSLSPLLLVYLKTLFYTSLQKKMQLPSSIFAFCFFGDDGDISTRRTKFTDVDVPGIPILGLLEEQGCGEPEIVNDYGTWSLSGLMA
ncbi:hypothetical protein TNCV_881591 [Trichonephila clavipes]|nr:hypothetical protein TNCV_881591 [Trichonephila clavipes]